MKGKDQVFFSNFIRHMIGYILLFSTRYGDNFRQSHLEVTVKIHLSALLVTMIVAWQATAPTDAAAGPGATVYEWRDANGSLHFTDNADRIPERFLPVVQERPGSSPRPSAKSAADAPAEPTVSPPAPALPAAQKGSGLGNGEKPAAYQRLADELQQLQAGLAQKKKDLARLRHRWTVAKGRMPTDQEVKEFEQKRLQGKASAQDNPYVNKNPLSTPGRARQAYFAKRDEMVADEERVRQLERELAAMYGK